MTKEYFKQLRKEPEAALAFIISKLEVLLEQDPNIDWKYQITEMVKDFKEE